MASSNKKTVLVTGCSAGSIGDALAKEFHGRGFHVIATARSLSRLQDLAPLGIQIEELDVTSSSSIQTLRSKITSLDILFNNAGGLHVGFLSDSTLTEWRETFDQNFFSVVEITQAFLPLLLESKGIIVNHSSQTPYYTMPGTGMYAVSKKAVCHYTDILRSELQPFGVRVVELMTGVVASNIVLKQMPKTPYKLPPDSIYMPIKKEFEEAMSGERVQTSATTPEVHARKVVGELLDGWRVWGWMGAYDKPWIWQGFTAGVSWWFWLIGCFWKGLFDPLYRRLTGLHLLKGRIEEQKKTK